MLPVYPGSGLKILIKDPAETAGLLHMKPNILSKEKPQIKKILRQSL